MEAKRVTPILNVSNIEDTFGWFEKLGWHKAWEWGSPAGFAGVYSGDAEIFLCHDCQGGRGEKNGMWVSIWVDDVDAVYEHCVEQGIDVTMPPEDKPWNVREMHVRHPDGHVFRIGRELEET
jgi:uncharacterized glyoxalase superfamily protein PhnB